MKRKISKLLSILLCMVRIGTFAHDFEVPNADGIMIYYRIINDKELAVTTKGDYEGLYSYNSSESIVIPEYVSYYGRTFRVTSIDRLAFRNNTKVVTIIIPNSITSIGDLAFEGSGWYKNQPDGLVYAGKVAYKYKGNMPDNTSIAIKEGTLGIGTAAFSDCKGLISISIPESVISIGSRAFSGCVNLSSLTIPNSVVNIGGGAFTDTPWYNNQPDGLVYVNKIAYRYKGSNQNDTSVEIREGTLSISGSAFSGCDWLESIKIPNSVNDIGGSAFSYCTGLTSITIPNHVSSLKGGVFKDCKSLIDITLPNTITSIGDGAFVGCTGLKSINIPNTLRIGFESFMNCYGLSSVTMPREAFAIKRQAFAYCRSLKTVTIPYGVKRIDNEAFRGCLNLATVDISSSVLDIGDYAFCECNGLTTVSIGNNVSSIGQCAFADCVNLTNLILPNSVSTIKESAFNGCSSLKSISLSTSLKNIGDYVFRNCSSLASVTIPNNITSIDRYAFSGCNIKTLSLSENLRFIRMNAFMGNRNLKSLIIPASVEAIYQEAFANCGLEEVKVLAKIPPYAYDNSFNNYKIPLYVPASSVGDYQSTSPWNMFASIKTLSGEDVETRKCEKPTIKYNHGEIYFSCGTDGVGFISSISDSDIKDYTVAKIPLTATYTISVHATKEGYQDSDIATATLCWIDKEPATEGITSVSLIKANAVMIQNNGGILTIQGAEENTPISIYELNGTLAGTGTCRNGIATINTRLKPGSMAVVKIGEKSVKIIVK